jgi:transcriptional regulator with XRE-family HTH domain
MKIRLRAVRERRLMTQDELAAKAKVAQTTISAIEQGKQEPRVTTVRKLAAAMGVEPEELIDTKERP